jgi:hypothetical protein
MIQHSAPAPAISPGNARTHGKEIGVALLLSVVVCSYLSVAVDHGKASSGFNPD